MVVTGLALSPLASDVNHLARSIPQGDKLVHGGTFAVLMLVWGNILRDERAHRWLVVGGLLLGGLIELAQWPIARADADPFDLLADALGLGLGLALLRTPLADVLARAECRLRQRG